MVRRTVTIVVVVMTTIGLLLPASAGLASAPHDAGHLLLATEVGEAPGPDPLPPDAERNYGVPSTYEAPEFGRFVALVLTAAAVLGGLGLGYLYFLLVWRPRRVRPSGA